MNSIEPNVAALLWFTIAASISSIGFYVLSGAFPLRGRPDLKGPIGSLLASGGVGMLLLLIVATLVYGADNLRWTSLVIVMGLAILFAPGLVDLWPSCWRDGPLGLFIVCTACGLMTVVLQAVGPVVNF